MPSAFILAARGYPAMPLARQLAHQRCVLSNPLVLGEKPLTFPAPTTDRDRPVSRRSKPSSRTAFIGEQPNPWELLHPQDAMSRHRMLNFHSFLWHRLCLHPVTDCSRLQISNCRLQIERQNQHDLAFLGQESAYCNDSCKQACACSMIEAFPFGSVVTGSWEFQIADFKLQIERQFAIQSLQRAILGLPTALPS
jgi:hypothetical protein